MATNEFKIQGIKKLVAKLNNLKDNAQQTLSQALEVAAIYVESEAKQLAPVDMGLLRASINHEVISNEDATVAVVGTNLEYARYVEFGTGLVGKQNSDGKWNIEYKETSWVYYSQKLKRFVTTSGQAPQPYLYPALENNISTVYTIIYNTLKQKVMELAK